MSHQFMTMHVIAYLMASTRPVNGVLSLCGTLNALKSKEPMSVGNWREAAIPVPSIPGMYSINGRCATWRSGGKPGTDGIMKLGFPSASSTPSRTLLASSVGSLMSRMYDHRSLVASCRCVVIKAEHGMVHVCCMYTFCLSKHDAV